MIALAALLALLVYLPIGYAAVLEARREPSFRPGDHRQWKRWNRHSG